MIHPIASPKLIIGAHMLREGKDSFYYPPHYHHDTTELLLVLEGQGEFIINGEKHAGNRGSLLCYNRGVWHEERNTSDKISVMYLTFAGLQLEELPANHLLSPQTPPCIPLGPHFFDIKQLFTQIIEEKTGRNLYSDYIADHLLGVLIGKIHRILEIAAPLPSKKNRSSYEAVLLVKRYMEENYHNPITLEDLSKLVHLNSFHLIQSFKETFGISPIQHLIRYRIDVAQMYLKSYDYTNKEIAEMVGYESDTYFQQIFKKHVGVTPREYRSQFRKEQS